MFEMFNGNGKEGVIIAFKNRPGTELKDLKKFCNRLYGYTDYSQGGRYAYKRKGLLSDIPHIRINPIRSVLVVKEGDAEDIISFLQEFGADIFARRITLEKEDIEKLEKIGKEERKEV